MELYKEILVSVLTNGKTQASLPALNTDVQRLVESRCYQALCRIKSILADDSLDDKACFMKIEEIVCVFEDIGSNGGSRHDFG